MTNVIEGFNQTGILKYNLDAEQLIFLNWAILFSATGKTKKWIDENGDEYFWIKYSKVLSDLPFMFSNIFSVRRLIYKVSGTSAGQKPLIKKELKTAKGTETFFMFDPIVMSSLKESYMSSIDLLNVEKFKKEHKATKNNKKQKIPVSEKALAIFRRLTKFEVDGKKIFSHEPPVDSHHYTSLYGSFQNAMFALYEGYFLKTYDINKTQEWFQTNFKYYLRMSEIKKRITACKGDWSAVSSLMVSTMKHYIKWFSIDSEQKNKTKLPRNINQWLFEPHTGTAMFYVCILEPPTHCREASAERVYEEINSKCAKLFTPLLTNASFDGFGFWNRIRNLQKWFDTNSAWCVSKDSNCSYWLGQGRFYFMNDYKEWLLDFTNKNPTLSNIGVGNKTWDCYVNHKIKEHGIEATIPRTN